MLFTFKPTTTTTTASRREILTALACLQAGKAPRFGSIAHNMPHEKGAAAVIADVLQWCGLEDCVPPFNGKGRHYTAKKVDVTELARCAEYASKHDLMNIAAGFATPREAAEYMGRFALALSCLFDSSTPEEK